MSPKDLKELNEHIETIRVRGDYALARSLSIISKELTRGAVTDDKKKSKL